MKKILIINQNSGYLTIDVANAFSMHYDEVVVMYGYNRVTKRDFNPTIKIQKTIKYNRKHLLSRFITWSLCLFHLIVLLLIKYRKYSILYYTNPPFSYAASLFFKNKFGIVVFDVYPDVLKLVGVSKKNIFYKSWVYINKKIYRRAQKIITLSESMKSEISKYVDSDKIHVVSIWPASEQFKPIPKNENIFLKKNLMEDKFIILYSGNMGIGHKLEIFIEIANDLRNISDLLFLFIGEGAKKKLIMNLAYEKKLNNVVFLSWQSSDMLPYSLAAADVSVVSLEFDAAHASVPSKTFNYMGVGSPIIGLGRKGTELEKLINNYELGSYFQEDNQNEIKNFILLLFQNQSLRKKFSTNAYDASKKFTCKLAEEYIF